ncbi:ExbD/TolR family protein [Methanobacterium aggregans]|uniref:ExbD/TolR family protein n=1 Tax=Methanobacterium aggregans TaxID=1615586 RepID=UPI001AE0ECB1|nr:biopolymer transporter ExbD [Methanobacterium aggregans]MBP2045772.1 biopolymer transport protein ExbD [Methanobacterium aggregans]
MTLDTQRYRNKMRQKQARVNLVPLIDVIFTILIFLMVTSSFQAAADTSSSSGKPEVIQTNGTSEYYLIPVSGLKTVTVNGVDMSKDIRNSAIAVHTDVIDYGEIIIKSKEGTIIITSPSNVPTDKAVSIPQS